MFRMLFGGLSQICRRPKREDGACQDLPDCRGTTRRSSRAGFPSPGRRGAKRLWRPGEGLTPNPPEAHSCSPRGCARESFRSGPDVPAGGDWLAGEAKVMSGPYGFSV